MSTAANSNPVATESGIVAGVKDRAACIYKGIPFAAPPIGDLRWRAPQAAASWSGIKTADAFSPICPQQDMYPPDAPPETTSEDCLYLNIWAPAKLSAEKLPVMVWIYGGGWTNGSASTPLYAGDKLIERDVIVVTANYRVGVLGFLAHPALSQEAAYGSSGNYGLLDQVAALQWVQRNIEAFGGDPTNVTVFGQSSGSISISALVASPLADGLFQRAIGQSGGLFEPVELFPNFKLPGAEQEGEDWVSRTGAVSISDLRGKTPDELMKTLFNPHLIVDGYALPQSPYNTYQSGAQNDVDLLIGTNFNEGQVFLLDQDVTLDTFEDVLGNHFSKPVVWAMNPTPGDSDASAHGAAVRFEGDLRFRWDMWTWAQLSADAKDGGSRRKTFFYQFSHPPPFGAGHPYLGLGVPHSVEMPYVFDALEHFSIPRTDEENEMASVMTAYWTNFAKTGDPNSPELPHWPEFNSATQHVMILGSDFGAMPIPNLDELQNIDGVYALSRLVMQYWQYILIALTTVLLTLIVGAIVAIRRRHSH
ncbi:MAG: carboxylesterase family protein [Alphaproteobacteria bacterium]|nr:carboxylesterase family protein [Alphaproteobacteria bacterium]